MDHPLTLRILLEASFWMIVGYFTLACFGVIVLMHALSGGAWPLWYSKLSYWMRTKKDRHGYNGPTKLGL